MNNLINKLDKLKEFHKLNSPHWFPDNKLDMKDIGKLVFIVTTIEKKYDDDFSYIYKQKMDFKKFSDFILAVKAAGYYYNEESKNGEDYFEFNSSIRKASCQVVDISAYYDKESLHGSIFHIDGTGFDTMSSLLEYIIEKILGGSLLIFDNKKEQCVCYDN